MSLVLSTGAQLNSSFFSSSNFLISAAEWDSQQTHKLFRQVGGLAVPLALLLGFNIGNGSFLLCERSCSIFSVSWKTVSVTGCSPIIQDQCHHDYGLISSLLTNSEHWQGNRKVPMEICSSQHWIPFRNRCLSVMELWALASFFLILFFKKC